MRILQGLTFDFNITGWQVQRNTSTSNNIYRKMRSPTEN